MLETAVVRNFANRDGPPKVHAKGIYEPLARPADGRRCIPVDVSFFANDRKNNVAAMSDRTEHPRVFDHLQSTGYEWVAPSSLSD